MEVGVVLEVCSFVLFLYMLSFAFKKLFAEGPHENLAMKIGLVCIFVILLIWYMWSCFRLHQWAW